MMRFVPCFRFVLLALCVFGLLPRGFVACARAAETAAPAGLVAMVNDEPITAEMVIRELVRIHNQGAHDTSRTVFSVDKLVQRLINDRLMAQEARTIGLDQDSSVVAFIARHRSQVALQVMLAKAIPDTFTVTEDELRVAFARDFRRVELRMVSVSDSLQGAAIADSIRRGTPMERMAAAHSIDRFKNAGGLTGLIPLVSVPGALQMKLQTTPDGELIGPMGLWGVFCVLRVERRAEADTTLRLDSVRTDLAAQMSEAKQRAAQYAFSAKLHADFPVVIDSARVDSVLAHMVRGETPAQSTVATIGTKREISETDVRNKYIHKTVGRIDNDNFALLYAVLTDLVEAALLEEAAARSDAAHLPETEKAVRAYGDSLLVVAYLEDVVSARVKVTDEDVAAHYAANKDRYREQTRFKVATLTRATEAEAAEDLRTLQSGTDFAWLARRNSTDEARAQGGDRDWVPADKVPGDAAADLDTLAIGAFTGPIASESGYLLIKLLGREAGAVVPAARVETLHPRTLKARQGAGSDQRDDPLAASERAYRNL